jgi:hypothetical protein
MTTPSSFFSGEDDGLDAELGEQYYKSRRAEEERLADEITAIIRQFIQRRFDEGRRPALRDAHAADIGCVRASFRVDGDLDPALQRGIFIPGRRYDAWIRFSNGNSEINGSRFPDARGMAIKLLGVSGSKLLNEENATQDFVMADRPVFFVDDLERYKESLLDFHSGGRLKQLVAIRRLKGREKYLGFMNSFQWITNPLFRQYWSMTAYRLGAEPGKKMAIKFSAKPRLGPAQKEFQWTTFFRPGFSLKEEAAAVLSQGQARFDFYIQRHVDDRTPVEDTGTEWKESVSRPEHAAEILIPSQDLFSTDRDRFCENLSFNPWHTLHEHKPLGAVNRVRKKIYVEISTFRHRLNHVSMTEPDGLEKV